MWAAALDYEHHELTAREVPEPRREGGDQVLFRVHEVGVCGTDRELAAFRIGYPPAGESFLVLGHEAVGQVIETGSAAGGLSAGDWVVPMVRRPCKPPCPSCARNRRDLCLSGRARERGIFGLHGYFTSYALDRVTDLVRVPAELLEYAVLIEPLSVVEKVVDTALRLHEPGAAAALVLGAGPIGLLAALTLRLRGFEVALHSLEPPDHPRARLAAAAGIEYLPRLNGRHADVIIEATGSAEAALAAIRALAPLGVCGILGASVARGEISFVDLLVKNQIVFGSVNASPQAFAHAVEDLGRIERGVLERMVHRARFSDFRETIPAPPGEAAKIVHVLE